jgi:hypothetical protein
MVGFKTGDVTIDPDGYMEIKTAPKTSSKVVANGFQRCTRVRLNGTSFAKQQ